MFASVRIAAITERYQLQMEFRFRLFSHNRAERQVRMIRKFQSHETQTDVRVRRSHLYRTSYGHGEEELLGIEQNEQKHATFE